MITTVSGASALQSALASAQSGDTILLDSGSYGALRIAKMNFASDVTIAAAPGAAPVFSTIGIYSSSGLRLENLEVNRTDAGLSFEVQGSQDIHFVGLDAHGVIDGNTDADLDGILVQNSANISFEGSEFHELRTGIGHLNVEGLVINDNSFHDIRAQAIRGGGSSDVTVARNHITDMYPIGDDHPDAIQFWTTDQKVAVHDIVVTGNSYIRGEGRIAQGIFIRDEVGTLPYARVTITENLISGGMYNGIAVGHATDVKVVDNVVVGYSDMRSWISLGDVDGAVSRGNVANEYLIGKVTNLVKSDDVVVGLATDKGVDAGVRANAASARNATDPDEVIVGRMGADTLDGGPGNDIITDAGGANYLRGGDGADRITGGGDFDDMNGNAGNDTVSGGPDNDWVVGGRDNDSLDGGTGNDLVYGNLGADTCVGGDGADTLRGGQDDDLVLGGAGNDYLSGDKGSDTMTGGAGADVFHSFGDAGLDRITDFNVAQGDRLQLDAGTTYQVSQVGADTIVDMGGGGQVILAGVSMSSLTPGWIFGA